MSLQGAFELHAQALENISAFDDDLEIQVTQVRKPEQLVLLDGIILPGGESTVIGQLLTSSGLAESLKVRLEEGLPALGTCAGLILLANFFKVLDVGVERNAYGAQIESFETQVKLSQNNESFKAFFIRAPKISGVGPKAKIFAELDDEIVGVIQDNVIGITFHPEVAKSAQVHEIFVTLILKRLKS